MKNMVILGKEKLSQPARSKGDAFLENILKNIISVIAELDSTETITLDSHLIDDLGLDSLMMIDLIIDIDDQLGVKIDGRQKAKLQTFGDLVRVISELKAHV
jgi:acyl carrier protein